MNSAKLGRVSFYITPPVVASEAQLNQVVASEAQLNQGKIE